MGMRLASSRHLDVVVMAPALTEAGQSQNLKLPPNSHPSPASPIGVPLNGLNNITGTVSQLLRNGHLGIFCKVGPTIKKVGCTSDKFNDQCLNGLTKGLAKYPSAFRLNNLTTLAIASEIAKVSDDLQPLPVKPPKTFMRTSAEKGDSMMNNITHMGDQDDNMGLQKSNTSLASLETGNMTKDKNLSNDMDQLLKNLGADIGGSGDLTQNVEDLLQVIKNMESNTADTESANALSHMDGPEHEMFPIADGTDLAGGLSTFERDLFNDEDVMNLCVGVNLGDTGMTVEKDNKDALTKERIADASKKQIALERKCEWLFRRLRKLQARTMGKHAGEELTGLLEQADRLMSECIEHKEIPSSISESTSEVNINSANQIEPTNEDLKSVSEKNMWKEIKRKGISPSAMSSVIRRLDLVAQKQSTVKARRRLNRYFRLGSHEPLSGSIPRVIPPFDENTRQDMIQVSDQLRTQFSVIESSVDSDATASSSDGESCDEMQSFNNHHQLHLSIAKRAAWKWAKDRAEVACRWTWLQAQISDLEFRIRQQNDTYRQTRAAKGPVILCEEPPSAAVRNHSVNGFHGILPGASPSKPCDEVAEGMLPSRMRPLNRALFRKRRLLQSSGLHLISKKAARPSTITCNCNLEANEYPCMICTGRLNPTAGIRPELMTLAERISLLDPSFHPVLSFRNEASVDVHLAALLHCNEWQQKMLRTSVKALKTNNMRDKDHSTQQQVHDRLDRRNIKVEQRRKYKTRFKKNILHSTLSAKLKRKLTRGRKPRGYNQSISLQRLKRKLPMNEQNLFSSVSHIQCEDNVEDSTAPSSATGGSVHPSPIPSPVPMGFDRFGKDMMRRKRENSYDIDNIVIPYSIASATRVEKLPYKEIPTPGWRLVEPSELNGLLRRSSQEDSYIEDLSDEVIKVRHDKCQVDERKKFMSYIKLPHSSRGRANRRFESLAESSGANTPDAMSPINMLDQGTESCTGSPIASPPSTPQPISMDLDSNICQALTIRRRTISQSRWYREREELFRTGSPDSSPEVLPHEERTFPLADEMYDEMIKEMPEGHPLPQLPQVIMEAKSILSTPTKDSDLSDDSRPVSPSISDSSDSLLGEGEDPNDPEWTVAEELELDRERQMKR